MSNDGGVIIYGIGEDENKRLKILSPFSLDGQPERISSIAQTSIAEPPRFHIHTIPTKQEPSKGYIVIVIPPSERAPHMVIVSGDHRYYGRNAKGNILLSEAEVSRLYERRKQSKVDLRELLEKEIQRSPYPSSPQLGYLHVFIRPIFELPGVLEKISTPDRPTARIFSDFVEHLASQNPIEIDYYPRFNSYINRWDFTSNGLRGKLSTNAGNEGNTPEDALILNIDSDGTGHLFCGRAAELNDKGLMFFWPVVAGNIINFMLFMGELFKQAGYIGVVDIGLAITGIRNAIYYSNNRLFRHLERRYESDDYKVVGKIDAVSLTKSEQVLSKSEEMLAQLFRALTQSSENPLAKLIRR